MTNNQPIKIGFINTNRDPYPLPPAAISGGMIITGHLVEEFAKKSTYQIYLSLQKIRLYLQMS